MKYKGKVRATILSGYKKQVEIGEGAMIPGERVDNGNILRNNNSVQHFNLHASCYFLFPFLIPVLLSNGNCIQIDRISYCAFEICMGAISLKLVYLFIDNPNSFITPLNNTNWLIWFLRRRHFNVKDTYATVCVTITIVQTSK